MDRAHSLLVVDWVLRLHTHCFFQGCIVGFGSQHALCEHRIVNLFNSVLVILRVMGQTQRLVPISFDLHFDVGVLAPFQVEVGRGV